MLTVLTLPMWLPCKIPDLEFEAETGEELAKALLKNSTLRILFTGANLMQHGGARFREVFESNTSLTELDLSQCRLMDTGSILIAGLAHNHTLRQLYLAGNRLGDSFATALSQAMEHNSTLEELNLDNNKFTHEGLSVLLDAVYCHPMLTSLSINACIFGEQHSAALTDQILAILRDHSTLVELSIHHCDIAEEDILRIADALVENMRVTNIACRQEFIGDETPNMIARMVGVNQELSLVKLQRILFPEDFQQPLEEGDMQSPLPPFTPHHDLIHQVLGILENHNRVLKMRMASQLSRSPSIASSIATPINEEAPV